MLELSAIFESWHVWDGNYPPLDKGEAVNLSFCVDVKSLFYPASSEKRYFNRLAVADYDFCGEVLYILEDRLLAVIDSGDFRFYIHSAEVRKLRVGTMVKGNGTLVLDTFLWVENYAKFVDPPDIFFTLVVTRIQQVKIPDHFISRHEKGKAQPSYVSPSNFADIKELDTMEGQNFDEEFYIVDFKLTDRKDVPRTFLGQGRTEIQSQETKQLTIKQKVNRQACGLIAGFSLILCILVSIIGWLVWSAAPQIFPAFLTEIAQFSAPTVITLPTKTARPRSSPARPTSGLAKPTSSPASQFCWYYPGCSTPSLPGYNPHRIAVRVVEGVHEFYDRNTGEPFVPRGHNYNRLSPFFGNSGQLWEETLNPGFYDPNLAEEALEQMHADGYNIVRVIIDCCRPSSNAGSNSTGISTAYINNVIDFLNKAKSNEVFVLLVLNLTPADGPYNQHWMPYTSKYGGANLRYLTRGGFDAKAQYDKAFIQALIEREAPLDIIFAYDLSNEIYYDLDVPPFDKKTGTLTPVNGKTYDMSQSKDRQLMMDENMVFWIDEQRAAILEVDPTALVTASFMIFDVARPEAAIWHSTVDFVDIHLFMGSEWASMDFKRYFPYTNQGKSNGLFQKPIIVGKFAAAKMGFQSAANAAKALLEWQAISCQYGVVGWLLTDDFEFLYSPFSDEGIINNTLAPINRPNPCLNP